MRRGWGGRGRGSGTWDLGARRRVREAGEGVQGPRGWDEGWGRQGKESRELRAGGRGPGGCMGKVWEGVPGPGGQEVGRGRRPCKANKR